jgi:hypothetical protein
MIKMAVAFEKKFGNKIYKVVYVQWASSDVGYGGETRTKEKATLKAKKLREMGISVRLERELHIKDPHRGPEVFYSIYVRKNGITLDQAVSEGRKILGV